MSKQTHLGADFGFSLDELEGLSSKISLPSNAEAVEIDVQKSPQSRITVWTAKAGVKHETSKRYTGK